MDASHLWCPPRPALFVIYINDNDLGLNNFVIKFADDTKIGNVVLTECDRRSLQEDLRKISDWSAKWEMPFIMNERRWRHYKHLPAPRRAGVEYHPGKSSKPSGAIGEDVKKKKSARFCRLDLEI